MIYPRESIVIDEYKLSSNKSKRHGFFLSQIREILLDIVPTLIKL